MAPKSDIVAKFAALDRLSVLSETPTASGAPDVTGNATARYMATAGETNLYPRAPFTDKAKKTAAEIDQWIDFSLAQIVPLIKAGAGIKELHRWLAVLDERLSSQTYLVGEHISLADIVTAVDLIPVFEKAIGPQETSKLPHLVRWFQTIQNLPQCKSVLGNVSYKTPQANGPAAAGSSKAAKPKSTAPSQKQKVKEPKAPKAPKAAAAAPVAGGPLDKKKESKLGITAKKGQGGVEFADWYTQVCTHAELISYYDVSGCYILRPGAYAVWEQIQWWFDSKIKEIDVENAYFPLFVTEEALNKEKDHVEGFAAEVAWVTRAGKSDLQRPIAIRPTSETVMYPHYAQWIRSHRDLPLKLNQWTNVVRWEFSNPTPFIRTREFLWQEGHTAHSNEEDAVAEVYHILDLYSRVYTDLLAVPVTKGIKSAAEKFAGSKFSSSVEGFIPSTGRGIQGGTSHCLGTNFSQMFKIQFEAEDKSTKFAWQNSWGLSTRTIGVMIMVHGDDKGLVMPPKVAPVQVIVIPIPNSKVSAEQHQALLNKAEEIVKQLRSAGIRVKSDTRDIYTPPWKYNHWETKGVPVRLAIGHKDMEKQTVELVRRDNKAKEYVGWADLQSHIAKLLTTIQADMYAKAKAEYDSCLEKAYTWEEFTAALDRRHMVLAPWCDEEEVERQVKVDSTGFDSTGTAQMGAKTLCIPLEQPPLPEGTKCFKTGKPAKNWALWGRSY